MKNHMEKLMSLSRRKFVALVGGGTILAATTGITAFVTTRTPDKALAPWEQAGQYADPRLRALSYALLAPNPHNRQPWEAELVGTSGVTLWRDETRNLPVTDPFARQLTIGMGCFLELMTMAAAQEGYRVEANLYPRGEDGPVAVCTFVPGEASADPLFAHVFNRRSHKEAFEARLPSAETLAEMEKFARIYAEGEDRDTLQRLARDAWLAEAATQDAWQESIDLLRIGKAEINAQPDGIDAGGPMLETLALLGIFTREAASDLNNPGSRDAIESTRNAIMSAPALTLTVTGANSRIDQIEAGKQWLHLNLAATGLGLALRPVSQALQEYPEVRTFYDEVHERFAPNGETVQMLGLLGYGALTPRTPRWPLETRLRDGQA